ncbi:MAG: OmpA family protein [Alphaproteobacteria bacterium]|nr:OmpA family protein [Alphaproteobacteria bacterium]
MKKISILLLILTVLVSCNKPLPEYLKKEQQRKDFKEKSDGSCPLSYLEEGKDILVANIYFNDNKSALTPEDNKIIAEIARIQIKCPQNILIIGHASNMEAASFANAISLSFNRAQIVAKQLQANKVMEVYINMLFCSNSNNLVYENDSNYKYNQRVDIVFITNNANTYRYNCIPTNKKNK